MPSCSGCGGRGVIGCPICNGIGKLYGSTATNTGLSVCKNCKGLGDISVITVKVPGAFIVTLTW
jgi:hypothetical protein